MGYSVNKEFKTWLTAIRKSDENPLSLLPGWYPNNIWAYSINFKMWTHTGMRISEMYELGIPNKVISMWLERVFVNGVNIYVEAYVQNRETP